MNDTNQKNTSALLVRDVIKHYTSGEKQFQVLKKINFEAASGEIYAIMGPSGAGKSTFLNVIGGLDVFDSGTITVQGQELSKLDSKKLAQYRNRHIGFIFQAHNLLKEFTALENVAMPLLIRGLRKKIAYGEAEKVLKEVGLENRLSHRPPELSGGEGQRVSVARALAGNPDLILADEPTGNLDRGNSWHLLDLLLELQQKMQKTIILVTHDLELAKKAKHIFYMEDGEFIDKEVS
jgi:ABC-type lipoprotein export system ATPase subunit